MREVPQRLASPSEETPLKKTRKKKKNDVSETCCNNGEDLAVQDLAECLGVLQVQIQFNDALFIISGDSGQIPLETVAFVAT